MPAFAGRTSPQEVEWPIYSLGFTHPGDEPELRHQRQKRVVTRESSDPHVPIDKSNRRNGRAHSPSAPQTRQALRTCPQKWAQPTDGFFKVDSFERKRMRSEAGEYFDRPSYLQRRYFVCKRSASGKWIPAIPAPQPAGLGCRSYLNRSATKQTEGLSR